MIIFLKANRMVAVFTLICFALTQNMPLSFAASDATGAINPVTGLPAAEKSIDDAQTAERQVVEPSDPFVESPLSTPTMSSAVSKPVPSKLIDRLPGIVKLTPRQQQIAQF